jgi:hypothetical protein
MGCPTDHTLGMANRQRPKCNKMQSQTVTCFVDKGCGSAEKSKKPTIDQKKSQK